jgi:hypothetical protein
VLYRNPLPEIARFLATYHQGRAKVYNLCSEHRYSADKLPGALLQQFPFDDHQVRLVQRNICVPPGPGRIALSQRRRNILQEAELQCCLSRVCHIYPASQRTTV